MASERQLSRCRQRLDELSESQLDSDSLRRQAIVELQRTIGFERWCWPLADPETLLPSSGIADHNFLPGVPRLLELEYSSDNFAAKHVVARGAVSALSLSLETGGDLARSSRWDEIMRPAGVGDIVTAACRDAAGCWGWIEAYRDSDGQPFDELDLTLLENVGPKIGTALRRRAMYASDPAPEPSAPGVVVLDRDLRPVSWTTSALPWIEVLPSAELNTTWGILPTVVYPAAALARAGNPAGEARALVRALDGRWVMIEAAPLEGERDQEIAVTLRAANGNETFELLCRVYALSQRERAVVELLVAGLDTRSISERLFISPHTVQDHLKSVFEKIGIHSRRELRARFAASSD
jgi:DNA-binding CsgD family transcriptional regulator